MDLNSQVTRRERGPNDIINEKVLQKTAFMKPVICFHFSRQGFSVILEPAWSSLYRTGYPQTIRDLPVCLPSGGTKGVCHHCPALIELLYLRTELGI